MTRDNLLFTVIGLLAGFISGYLLHEVMAARQPPRLPADHAAAATTSAPAAPGGNPAGGPPMEEVQRLEARLQEDPDDAQALRQLANLNYDIGRWTRAQELYERYLQQDPDNPDVMTDLGVCYRQLHDYQKALDIFDQVQRLQPGHWQSLYNEVVVLAFDLGNFDDARKALEQLRSLQPDNPDVQRLAAEVERRSAAA